jgi:hypothetical protein
LHSGWEAVMCWLCVRIASKVASHSGHGHKNRHLNSVKMYLPLLWACP